jgi:hypothetical protein
MQTNKTTITKIIINKEKYLTSLAKDFTSLAVLSFLFWFNYKFIGGSYFVNFLILIGILLYIVNLAITKSNKNSSVYFNVSQDKVDRIESILNENQHSHK